MDPPIQRGGRLLSFGGRKGTDGRNQNGSSYYAAGASPHAVNDPRAMYPCTIHHQGRLDDPCTLFAESASERLWWKTKLEDAIELRKVAKVSNKLFEMETLSVGTFFAPTLMANTEPVRNNGGNFTGKVTCSVPFSK